MRVLLLALIRFYKRFISPHKGYGCAYRIYTGRASCSTLGYRAIRRHGAWAGLGLLQQRCRKCGVAQRRYAPVYRRPAAQRGDCDPGCDLGDCNLDGCDPGGCDQRDCELRPRVCRTNIFDILECCGGDCGDCGGDDKRRERKRKNKKEDAATHLPPRKPRRAGRAEPSRAGPDDARR